MKPPAPASDTTVLGLASIMNGTLAYAYTVVGLRAYGPEAFAPIALVWSVWALAVAATTFPIQHWVNWRGETDGGLERVRATMPALSGYVAVTALVAGALLWATVPTFRNELAWIGLAFVLVVGSGILGWGRGILAARGEYKTVAGVIAAENGIRFVVAGIVVLADGGVAAFGWSLATGPIVLVPLWRRLNMGNPGSPAPFLVALGGLSAAVLVAQGFVQLGPLATEWLGGTEAQISAVFATFALLRAPVLVTLGAVTRLTTPLTALAEQRSVARLIRLLRGATAAVVVGGPLVYFAARAVGPSIVEALFGADTSIAAAATGATALGMWLAVIGLILLVLHIATASTAQAFVIWGGAGALALAVAVIAGDPVDAVTNAFIMGETVAVVGSIGAHLARARTWRDG